LAKVLPGAELEVVFFEAPITRSSARASSARLRSSYLEVPRCEVNLSQLELPDMVSTRAELMSSYPPCGNTSWRVEEG
jgi:hypothetical protein